MKGEVIIIILIGLLFISTVLLVRDIQIDEDVSYTVIINETYEPKEIYGRPILKNMTTKLIIEPVN